MKNLLKIAGILACVAALGLNLQHAMDGYGIKSGNLHLVVWAADSGSGSSSAKTCDTVVKYTFEFGTSCDPSIVVYEKYQYSCTGNGNQSCRVGIDEYWFNCMKEKLIESLKSNSATCANPIIKT